MERITVPYKAETRIATFQGEWTAEQIDNGEAGEPFIEVHSDWYEPTDEGFVVVTDPSRIEELEKTIRK